MPSNHEGKMKGACTREPAGDVVEYSALYKTTVQCSLSNQPHHMCNPDLKFDPKCHSEYVIINKPSFSPNTTNCVLLNHVGLLYVNPTISHHASSSTVVEKGTKDSVFTNGLLMESALLCKFQASR